MSAASADRPAGTFDIGIAEIDLQHRQLEQLLENLKTAMEKRYAFAAGAILEELAIQTRIHFAVEESLMRLLAFPEAEQHAAEHRHLTEKLESFRRRAQDFDIAGDLAQFIESWLLDHVDHHDRRFVAHFLARGVDATVMPRPL